MVTQSGLKKSYDEFILKNFPSNEVKPLSHILRMMNEVHYMVLELVLGEKTVAAAYISTYADKKTYLLDYLAVEKDERSKGFGGILLQKLPDYIGDSPMLIETESLQSAADEKQLNERKRRNLFYSSNGARRTQIQTFVYGVEYDIWVVDGKGSTGTEMSDEKVISEMQNIYHVMVLPENYEKNITIPLRTGTF